MLDELNDAIVRANRVGAATVTLRGAHQINTPVKISSHIMTELERLDGVLTIDARDAVFHINGAIGFIFEGTAKHHGKHARIIFDGGRIHGGQVAIRCLDLMSSTISPYSIESADVGIQVCILRTWSENNGFGGQPGREMFGRRCRRILEFYSRAETWKFVEPPIDPSERDLKFESFAGTTVSDIVVAGATEPSIDGQVLYAKSASIYRSTIQRIRGNTPNGGGSLIWSDSPYWRGTTIRDISVEKANEKDKPQSAAIRFAAEHTARLYSVENVLWMGGRATSVDWGPNAGRKFRTIQERK